MFARRYFRYSELLPCCRTVKLMDKLFKKYVHMLYSAVAGKIMIIINKILRSCQYPLAKDHQKHLELNRLGFITHCTGGELLLQGITG